jgi:hypothetical protein
VCTKTIENKTSCGTKYGNIVKFRATATEIALLNDLKKAWQLSDISKVCHRILASFYGFNQERVENIAKIKSLIDKWQVQDFELHNK